MPDIDDTQTAQKPSFRVKGASRTGLMLFSIMGLSLLLALCHHKDPASSAGLGSNGAAGGTDALAAIPASIRKLLDPIGPREFGTRAVLKAQLTAAGALSYEMTVCTFPDLATTTTAAWAQAHADQGMTRRLVTVDEVKEWYQNGKDAMASALPAPTAAQCQQQLMEFNATGPARFRETRGVSADLQRLKSQP